MVAPNPKKKRTYATKATEKAAKKDTTSSSLASTSEMELIEQNLGKTLLSKVGATPKPTSELLEGKDLVGLYFGAGWSPACQAFNPILMDFYNQYAKPNGMEMIYISSDDGLEKFEEEYGTMPWLAMPGDQAGTALKHGLATNLKAFVIPTLVILNVKTGNFVTDLGRKEILELQNHKEDETATTTTAFGTRALELLQTWRTMDPIEIGHNSTVLTNLSNAMDYFACNPLVAVAVVAFVIATNLVRRTMDNPLIGVAFWFIFKRNFTGEKLRRNEPYMIQESKEEEKKEH